MEFRTKASRSYNKVRLGNDTGKFSSCTPFIIKMEGMDQIAHASESRSRGNWVKLTKHVMGQQLTHASRARSRGS